VCHGLEVLGGGSIRTGLVLGAVGVFIIERQFRAAAAFAFTGALLTYFGFMHGEAVGIGAQGLGVTPTVAIAYAIVAGFFVALSRAPEMMAATVEKDGAVITATPAE
jgi:AGZA family xanthine/uracil permease-like MFS transporter